MLKHFDKGVRLEKCLGTKHCQKDQTCNPARQQQEIIQRATERFDSSGDNTEGIRIGDFLRFTDVVSKGMEHQMKNQNIDDLKGFAGA